MRAFTLAGLLVMSGLVIVSPPAAADQWTKSDLGNPDASTNDDLDSMAMGDGDRDNITELYTTSTTNGHVYQYRVDNGSLTINDLGAVSYGYAVSWGNVVVGDGDDCGRPEVYVSGQIMNASGQYREVVQLVKESGGWTKTDAGAYGLFVTAMAIGDGDNDGRQEIFASDSDGSVYRFSLGTEWSTRNIGTAPLQYFPPPLNIWKTPEMTGVAVGDGDNDGRNEVYGASSDNHLYRFNYSGSGWSRQDMGGTNFAPQSSSMQAITMGDLDNDGDDELYAMSTVNGTLWKYDWNASSGLWERDALVNINENYAQIITRLCIARNSFEGRCELFAGLYNKQVYRVFLDNLTGEWDSSSIGSGNGYISGVAAGALSGDPDVLEVFASCGDGHVYEFHQDKAPPANPVVWSDTHPVPGTWYNQSRVHVLWADGTFDISGIDGYSLVWDQSSSTIPDDAKDCEQTVHELATNLSDGGSWHFHIRARDNALNWNLSAAHFGPVRIDTVPPDYAHIDINLGAKFTDSSNVNLSVAATDPSPSSGIAFMAFSNDGVSWSAWETFSAGRAGWDLSDPRFGGNDSDGMKSVYVKVRDGAGNEMPAGSRANASILLDRGAPLGLSIAINGGADLTADENVTLALGCSDAASGVAMMALSNDGADWTGWAGWQDSTGWSLTKGAGGSDADGERTVYLKARDRTGNEGGPVSAAIFLDRKAPRNLSVIINDGAVFTNSSDVRLNLSADDPAPGSGVQDMALAGNLADLSGWEPFSSSKDGWSLTDGPGGTDADGLKTVYLAARDRAGNAGAPASASIFLDRVPPGGLSVSINGGAACTTSPAVNLTFTAVDDGPSSGLDGFQFSGDGVNWSAWEPDAGSPRPWTLPAGDGNKTVFVRARDRAGNIAGAAFATIRLYTPGPPEPPVRPVPPTCVITSPANGSKVSGTVRIAGTAAGGRLPLASVLVRLDGTGWMPAQGLDNWSFHIDTATLAAGRHTLEARAFDGDLYSNTTSIEFTVRRPGPTVTVEPFPYFILAILVAAIIGIGLYLLLRRKPER